VRRDHALVGFAGVSRRSRHSAWLDKRRGGRLIGSRTSASRTRLPTPTRCAIAAAETLGNAGYDAIVATVDVSSRESVHALQPHDVVAGAGAERCAADVAVGPADGLRAGARVARAGGRAAVELMNWCEAFWFFSVAFRFPLAPAAKSWWAPA